MNDGKLYTFAYGMNMSPRGVYGSGQAGTLEGWALEYRQFADVIPKTGAVVPGVLWEIDARELRLLDAREGYPTLYTRDLVDVTIADGTTVRAWVYRMTPTTVDNYAAWGMDGISEHYRDVMIEGRLAFDHTTDDIPAAEPPIDPTEYLEALRESIRPRRIVEIEPPPEESWLKRRLKISRR